MSTRTRVTSVAGVASFALVASMAFVTPAFADDGMPDPATTDTSVVMEQSLQEPAADPPPAPPAIEDEVVETDSTETPPPPAEEGTTQEGPSTTTQTFRAQARMLTTATTEGVTGTLVPWTPASNQTSYWEDYNDHIVACYKYDANGQGNSSNDHGSSNGKTVTLNPYGATWPGDHWELLVVKGGSEYNNVIVHPTAGTAYASPLNNGGQQSNVSHWIACKGETPFNWNWEYAAPTCTALTVVYPQNIPNGQANDVNVRFENLLTNQEITLNFHKDSGTWSGTKVFEFTSHPNWPGWTYYKVEWVQVAGTNYHWEGTVTCGTPPPVDVCKNLDGTQTEVPSGYTKDGENCYPPVNQCVAGEGETFTPDNPMVPNDMIGQAAGYYVDGGFMLVVENGSSKANFRSGNDPFPLHDVGTLSIQAEHISGTVNGLGLNLYVDADGDLATTSDRGTMVYEEIYGQDLWVPATAANVALTSVAPSNAGGNGSAYHGTIDQWLAKVPNAVVLDWAINYGRIGASVWIVKRVGLNCANFFYGIPAAPADETKKEDTRNTPDCEAGTTEVTTTTYGRKASWNMEAQRYDWSAWEIIGVTTTTDDATEVECPTPPVVTNPTGPEKICPADPMDPPYDFPGLSEGPIDGEANTYDSGTYFTVVDDQRDADGVGEVHFTFVPKDGVVFDPELNDVSKDGTVSTTLTFDGTECDTETPPEKPTKPTKSLASTGADVGGYIGGGLLLLLVGGVLFALRRRAA